MSASARGPGPIWRRYLRFLRPNVGADIDDEIAFHIEMRVERNLAFGMTSDAARRDAEARFGDVTRWRHELIEHDTARLHTQRRREFMSDFLHDVRFGLRSLRRTPGFTAAAILTLALGIGANAAIFSVLDAVVLRPLPYARPQELVSIGQGSGGEFVALRERLRSFGQLALYISQTQPLYDGEEALRVEGAAVTTNLLSMLGARPLLGRTFTDEEARLGNHTVLVIGYDLWQSRFGGAQDVLGRRVQVEGAPFTIVGVMPREFHFPDQSAQYWQPFAFNEANVGLHWAVGGKTFIGRLAPAATLEGAQAEVAQVWPTLRRLNPLWDPGESYRKETSVRPFQEEIVGETDSLIWMLFGCVVLVLLIGCINVANLLLARATARQRELSVRAALGGGRGRLIRQLVTESLLLSVLGGSLGIGLAVAGVRWIVAAMPPGMPRAYEISVNAGVVVFTAAVVVATGVLFGIIPALRSTRFAPGAWFGQRATAGSEHHRVTGVLVAAEISLAVLLAVGSVLLLRSFVALREVTPGFETDRVLAARITPPFVSYGEPARVAALYAAVTQRVVTTPGVQRVGLVDKLPLAQRVWGGAVRVHGQFEDATRPLPELDHLQMIDAGYFSTMGIPIARGRAFAETDREDQPGVAIVSERVARRFWPNGDALGKQIGYPYPSPWLTIVGVVPDVRQQTLRDTAGTTLYVPWAQRSRMSGVEMWLLVRYGGSSGAITRAIREAVSAADLTVPVSDVRTMDAVVSRSIAKTRFTTLLVALFAAAALLLGAVGIYGVMSYVVGLRTREMGVRLALGARPSEVLGMVLKRSVRLAAIGTAIGLVAALFATRALSSQLYGISAFDLPTFAIVPALFLLVAIVASYAPGRRATRVDPVRALRSD